jgi:hypothetical protein
MGELIMGLIISGESPQKIKSGEGLTETQVDNKITAHNTNPTAHLTVVDDQVPTTQTLTPHLATRYLFGTLTSLTLASIPVSATQDIVIWFKTDATAWQLVVPSGTPVFGNLADIKKNMQVEMSVVNGIIHFNTREL